MDIHRSGDEGDTDEAAIDVGARLAGHVPAAGARPPHLRGRLASTTSAMPHGFAGRLGLGAAVDLRDRMAQAAARVRAEARRRTRRAIASVMAAVLSLGGFVLPAAAVVVTPGTLGGFEVDGNMSLDPTFPGTIDWANAGEVTVIADDTIDSAFQGSSAELDPADWVCQSKAGGVTPGKDNLLRAYVNARISASSAYLDLAFVKLVGEGDTHVNFEFNKEGEVVPYQEGPCPFDRAIGDLLFSYDFGGTSDPTSVVRVWKWDGATWAELVIPTTAAAATNNAGAIVDPLNGGATIPARSFGELSVDLLQIPGFTPTCPGFATVNIRSRSSGSSWESALQDKMPTTRVNLSTCGSVKLKKVDDLGAPLAGATFGLYRSDNTLDQQCTTDAAGICSFPIVSPGTYTVREIAAPGGYTPSPEVRTVTVTFRQNVDLTGAPFTNPLITGALRIVKINDANGQPVAGIRFELRQGGQLASTRTGADAACTTAADGTCTISNLVPGTYVLHEVASTVPATMTAVADQTVTIVGNQTLTVNVTDPVKPLGISLTKLVNGQESVTIHAGDQVTYTLRATNSGQVPIDVTSLTDNDGEPVTLPSACTAAVAATTYLAPGASQLLCTYTANPTTDVTNTGVVVGTDQFGRTATASDTASVDVITPAITLVKTVNGQESITVAPGTALDYVITVTNTGDTPLTVESFTDVETPGGPVDLSDCLPAGTVLAVGVPVRCTSSGTAPIGGVTDTAEVVATDRLGRDVSANDSTVVSVLNPDLAITKLVNGTDEITVHAGDDLTYEITVTNAGDAPIRLTSLLDVVGTGAGTLPAECASVLSADLLAAGASRSCTYEAVAGSTDRANTATVQAVEPVLGTPLTASDTALVHVIVPAITIDKSVTPTQAHAGDAVRYTLRIENTGTTPLTLTALTDKLGDAAAESILADCGFTTSTTLAVGQVRTCGYDGVAGADDTVNVARVTAVDVLGGAKGTVTDDDDAIVDVIHPEISITKDVSAARVHAGDTVTYTVRFVNTGDTPLTLTALVDSVNGAAAVSILTSCGFSTSTVLQPTEALSCTYDVVTGTVDLDNVATVRAVDAIGGAKGTVSATDDAAVDVLDPEITIEKTASPTVVRPGQDVTYTLVITNTGDADLTITALTDLANGQSVALSAECLGLVGDDLAIGASVDCTYVAPAGTADIHNVATVVAEDELDRDVTDDDDADVEVINPAITVTKDADKARAHAGDTITYTVVITNTGDTPLRLTELTDAVNGGTAVDLLDDCDLTTSTVLDPGESTDACTYTSVAGTADIRNVVEVTGEDKLGGTVSDDDPALVDVINPAITIEKSVDRARVHAGDTLTYTLVVTNTGDTALTITALDDAVNGAPAVSLTGCEIIGTVLAAGASATCEYTTTAGTGDLTNVATVVGEDELGKEVDDTDDAVVDVLNPAISIEKSVDEDLVHSGTVVTYTLVITNTGDAVLTITALDDAVNGAPAISLTACGIIGTTLAVGASTTCVYTAVAGDDDLTNVATVVGEDELDKEVDDTDDAVVDVLNPGIDIVKTVDKPVVHPGTVVTYTLVITNTGDADLTITALDDAVNGGPATSLTACGVIGTTLAAGASTTCTYTAVAGTVDLVNVAEVTGEDELDEEVTDDDDATVDVLNPAITIVKTADVESITGTSGPVTFTYLVTNTGDAVLVNVVVTDDILGEIGTIARLEPGQSVTLTRTATVTQAAPVNIGTAKGTDELGKEVQDSDDEDITFVEEVVIVRPAPNPPAPAPAPTLPRTGLEVRRQLTAGLVLLVLGGLALLPEYQRKRRYA
jgi:uncharacterized repeat protein (TIGR01451 family)